MVKQDNLNQAEKFTQEILPQVSRTFDLAIRFLPKNLGRPVGLAYLLCRVADTFEDSPLLEPWQRKELLLKYAELLNDYDTCDNKLIKELEMSFCGSLPKIAVPGEEGVADEAPVMIESLPSLRLVENLNLVFESVDMLPANFKYHIFSRVREMALGMANYTTLASGRQSDVSFLRDEADWDKYCYYVAGTVGHMLTDIFSDYVGFSSKTRERLHGLGRSFGLGLQKVNVLKDAVIDIRRGICFLPQTVIDRYNISVDNAPGSGFNGDIPGLVNSMVEMCSHHFRDSLEYINAIPKKHLGLRMFLIVPVMLAGATLRLFAEYPQKLLEKGDLKLTRSDVFRLVRRSSYCKFSNRLLAYSFSRLYPVSL
jgi:farnesyl-diphosphate farnesyltransferase